MEILNIPCLSRLQWFFVNVQSTILKNDPLFAWKVDRAFIYEIWFCCLLTLEVKVLFAVVFRIREGSVFIVELI